MTEPPSSPRITPCLEVFYDGACPICTREVESARRRDPKGRLRFTNIADPAFDPAELGVERAALDARIHARTQEGEVITGVEVFRRLYAELFGERWIAWTRAPLLARALDAGYATFARHRKTLSRWVPMPKS